MPIYRKGNAWRVVVHKNGSRKDVIVKGAIDDALTVEAGLRSALGLPDKRSRTAIEEVFIYFVQAGDDGPIKIGVAVDVEQRMIQLQTGNYEQIRLLACARAERLFEKQLHEKFSHLHIRGEWFKPGTDLLEAIDFLKGRQDV